MDNTVNRDIVSGVGDEFPEYDYQCSLISLPHLLQHFEINGKPYISPKATMNSKEQYPDTFNIGICWGGSLLILTMLKDQLN